MISYEQWQLSTDLFLGTMLGIAGVYAAAHGLLVHKKNFSEENIVVAVCVQMTCGGLLLTVAALVFEDLADFKVNAVSIGSIIYLAVLGSVIAFLCYFWLLKRISVMTLSLITFVTPVVAIAIGVLFFGESMTTIIAIGTAMILSGIVAVIRKPKPAQNPSA